MIAGVDEAGRGPLVGPMVVALVGISDPYPLEELPLKDSKKLSPGRREELYGRILDIADVVLVRRVEPFVIDAYVERDSLNKLELEVTAELIRESGADLVYVDAPDVDAARYGRELARLTGAKVVAEHRADERYPVVSAASIVAKVERDRIIRGIEAVYGRLGSGYPHDEETLAFVEYWLRRLGRYPAFVRRSWITAKRLGKKVFQRSLEDFLW